MLTRKRGLRTFSAIAIAMMLGLAGCGTAVTPETTKLMKEDAPKADNVEMTDDSAKADTMAVTYEKNFKLENLEGNLVSMEDYAGKKVVVKFWGTWCSVCMEGIDELEAFAAEQNAGSDVAVITIVAPNVNYEFGIKDFKQWYELKGYTFPVLFDVDGKVLREFGIRAFPTYYIYEEDGSLSTNRPGHIGNEDLKALLSVDQ